VSDHALLSRYRYSRYWVAYNKHNQADTTSASEGSIMSDAGQEPVAGDGQGSENALPQPQEPSLPPVEPPSARLIAQLFLIPGLVVAVLVGVVWLFFGWLAPGSYEPQDFLKGLRSQHDPVRWRTAQDLAQILPRKQELRLNVDFALQLTALLEEELERERSSAARASENDGKSAASAPHLAEFLPAAVGHFHVPVAVPVLCRIVRDHVRGIDYLPGSGDASSGRAVNVSGLRVRNSLVALATLGSRLEELEQLSGEVQEDVLATLQKFAERGDPQSRYARLAWEYLKRRLHADTSRGSDVINELRETLSLVVSCEDEMSRKYACLALANWPEPELEPLLLDLLRGDPPPTLLESVSPARAVLEIQYNAALALLRRHSSRIPWRLIEELLDENALKKSYYEDSPQGYNAAAVSMAQLAALRTLYDVERKNPGFILQHPTIKPLLEQLQYSGNPAVQVEARRILGTESVSGKSPRRISREVLLLVGVGLGVVILLTVAVLTRWKRHSSPGVSPADLPNSR
jgi:hypothetical protein